MSQVVSPKELFRDPYYSLCIILYINDLPNYITSCCSLFADDYLLYGQINNKNDQETLQWDLHNLELWASKMADVF